MPRRLLKMGVGAAVVAAQCLLAAGVAGASGGGVAEISGVSLTYTAAPGDANNIWITVDNSYYYIDDAVSITPGVDCVNMPADTTKVKCKAANVAGINVYAGDKDDQVVNNTGTKSFLRGEAGDDDLVGGSGDDTLRGGTGHDTFQGNEGAHDAVTYFDYAAPVSATLDSLVNDGPAGDLDYIVGGIEDLYGGSGPDVLTGDGSDNLLVGNDGDDDLFGWGGADTLSSGNGDDDLYGFDGADTLLGSWDDDYLSGGDGDDTILGHGGDDDLDGGAGHDTLDGGDNNDELAGGFDSNLYFGGADMFIGGSGVDTVSYWDHDHVVTADADGQPGDDGVVNSSPLISEHDTIGADVENLTGGDNDDMLIGNDSANVLDGGVGSDTMIGGSGIDTVTYAKRVNPVNVTINGIKDDGESGENDQILGIDNLIGGTKNDTLKGNQFKNHLDGGPGNNTLDGMGDTDVCVNGPVMLNCNP